MTSRAKKAIAFEITIPVEDVTGNLTLRQFIGKGSFGKDSLQFDLAIPTHSPMIRFRGREYLVDIREIIKAICARAPPAK